MARMKRSLIVNPALTRLYHVTSRCVRKAFLLLSDDDQRRNDLYQYLRRLEEQFAVEVVAYALMSNHLHLILRLNPAQAEAWSPQEVVRRWAALHPPRNGYNQPVDPTDAWIDHHAADPEWVEKTRAKLASLSQFMKELKQHVAQQANKADQAEGSFWAGRFKSVALMDEAAILAACAYVDLNPFAAGLCETPEQGQHTSLHERVAALQEQRSKLQRQDADTPQADPPLQDPVQQRDHDHTDTLSVRAAHQADQRLWLTPMRDPLDNTPTPENSSAATQRSPRRHGLFRGFSLIRYLRLVDHAARLLRAGKARLDASVAPILKRLGVAPHAFATLWERLHNAFTNQARLGHRLTAPRGF